MNTKAHFHNLITAAKRPLKPPEET